MEETIYEVEEDDSGDETVKVCWPFFLFLKPLIPVQTLKKQSEMLFVRGMATSPECKPEAFYSLTASAGDSVVLISPQA